MRWEYIDSNPDNEIYHLYKEDKVILRLTLHPFSNTARVECEKQKRIFLIRKEGFRRNKIVLRTEYGIRIGELGQENGNHYININDERFFYAQPEDSKSELVLFKESPDNPFVTCSLDNFKKDKQLSGTSHPGLLIALCWYMFLPMTREEKVCEVV